MPPEDMHFLKPCFNGHDVVNFEVMGHAIVVDVALQISGICIVYSELMVETERISDLLR